jgi:hypothetical protein
VSGQVRFGVTSGMRGFFAVMYDDEGPIQSGIGSYDNSTAAALEAMQWAEAEGFSSEASRLRMKYDL